MIIRKKLQAKFKYICIEQNRKYFHSVVITETGRKSNLQRNQQIYINATSEYRFAFLYCFWMTIFQILLKKNEYFI